jgi:hypothetical protein
MTHINRKKSEIFLFFLLFWGGFFSSFSYYEMRSSLVEDEI